MKKIIGKMGRDTITGFEGVVTGYTEYISGCAQVLITPPVKEDGSHNDGHWFDLQRVETVEGAKVELQNEKTPGPDKAAPVR